MIGSLSFGQYVAAGGSSVTCTLSGVSYDFHSCDFGGQVRPFVFALNDCLLVELYLPFRLDGRQATTLRSRVALTVASVI